MWKNAFLLVECRDLPKHCSSGSQLSRGGRSSWSRIHWRVLPRPPLRRRPTALWPERRPGSRRVERAASRSALRPPGGLLPRLRPPGPLRQLLPWAPTAARPGRSWRGPAPCTCRRGTCSTGAACGRSARLHTARSFETVSKRP